jgi:uncharacterized repeat protein (TIGR01451 family)
MFGGRSACGWGLALAIALGGAAGQAAAQGPLPVQPPAPAGVATVGPDGPAEGAVLMPADVVVVRIQGPEGIRVEVLGPETIAVPGGDGHGLATLGMRVGVAYRLRLSNLPNREDAELFPVVQLVGHLHRPPTIDPSKYPLRIQLTDDDIEDVLRSGRLVTEVVYLEDPEQALPLHLPKDEIPVVTLSPAEDPLKVAAALGRPMAIVQIGNRAPLPGELDGAPIAPIDRVPCPFVAQGGAPCGLPCGPARGTPPPPGRSWLPRDEYLCDGGDHNNPAGLGGDGNLRGIDPRDAVFRFQTDDRPRVLPTNMVCLYAPRFAAVRRPFGATAHVAVDVLAGHELLQRPEVRGDRQAPRRLAQNVPPQGLRGRSRPSIVENNQRPAGYSELRVLDVLDTVQHIRGHVSEAQVALERSRRKPDTLRERVPTLAIKTAESAVVHGIVAGPNEQVMAWKPQETVGVEEPPRKPGLAVIKQADRAQAEPGDVVTFTIRFRNMGNVPIHSVSVVDSLMPRLEYVARSAQGPVGTVFTAAPNTAGSTELRWDLPGALAPGAEGSVSFEALVR